MEEVNSVSLWVALKEREEEDFIEKWEVFEEVGLHIKLLDVHYDIYYEPKPGVEKKVTYFLATSHTERLIIQTSENEEHYKKNRFFETIRKMFKAKRAFKLDSNLMVVHAACQKLL